MITVIFSLGQFISSDLKKLKDSFQTSLAQEHKEVDGETVWNWITPYLPRLRLAKISLEELCQEFNTHFSSSLTFAEFKKNFNSMSQVDANSLHRIEQFRDYLSEHPDVRFLIVSHTNTSHFDFIMDQLEPVLPNCRSGVINNQSTADLDSQMLFATSMYSQCEKHPDTLQRAITQLEIDLDQPIISFLNTVQELKDAADFTYIQADAVLNTDKVIEQLDERQRCGVSLGF
ncbi:hypothetical protein [Legionella bononiensis]|uniref:Uncharacterized protein n=1 Tax=Legionella bononiensis TaxID=2793102 RepID=A0ABS1W6Q5_9GAMM|nr:hypothetical protein [Legionella bononiensis]MBL7478450.1 hypothetical protein [Legionella bononiensis]MBL7525047.1 hypothetical protein [Legionella bononiensis]MBL7561343.1 hypothetical protein [Legionella bononiensis]